MAAPVDWELAERIAIRIASRHPVPAGAIDGDELRALAVIAQDRVEAATGLRSLHGPAEVCVIDRPAWIRANIASFRGLIDPVMTRWMQAAGRGDGFLAGITRQVTGQITAAEVGAMLGWMSGRVLGQYDLLFGQATTPVEGGGGPAPADGAVYLVGPNMLALEHRFAFEPEQFRLWVTLHELTHRTQFTGVPWMHQHFMDLVQRTLALADPDPSRMVAGLRAAFRDRDAARQRMHDGGIVAMIATAEQQAVFRQVAGLMSLLEGHGDVVMDRAGADLVPSAERFARVLHERRQRANPLVRLVQLLIGLEGKLNQYAAGERFIAAIEAVGGERAVDRCWERPENLPTLDEIRSPGLWLERVGADEHVA
ncbi:MAG: zinc-dependent metalloprotease [Ilumatobacteraceae bacterium]